MRIAILAASVLFSVTAFGQTLPISQQLLEQKNKIYDEAMTGGTTSRWLETEMNRIIKDPLDAEVDHILATDPIGLAELPNAMREVEEIIKVYSLSHLQGTTVATPNQSPKLAGLYKLAQEVAHVLNFSPTSRQNMTIYAAQGEVNAYTFSGDPEQIHAVFFDDLLKRMNDGNLRQILGHEFWHIRGRHIPNRIRLYAIFYATGRSVIPPAEEVKSDEDKEKAELFAKHLDKFLTKMARTALSHAGEDMSAQGLERLKTSIRTYGEEIRKKNSKASLLKFSNKVLRTVRGQKADEEVTWDIKDLKKFEEDLERLSRSQETSCDRAGYIANAILGGPNAHRSSVEAYIKLFASEFSNVEEQMKQIDLVLGKLSDPALAGQRFVGSSHPATLSRARLFEIFRHEAAFEIYSDPFLRVLHDYFSLTQYLIELRQRIYSGTNQELLNVTIADVNRNELTQLARKLADWIVAVLDNEMAEAAKGNVEDLPLFAQFTDLIQTLVYTDEFDPNGARDGFDYTRKELMKKELGRPKRVVQDLAEKFKANETAAGSEKVKKLYAKAVEMLEGIVPPEDHSRSSDMEQLVALAQACGGKKLPPGKAAKGGA